MHLTKNNYNIRVVVTFIIIILSLKTLSAQTTVLNKKVDKNYTGYTLTDFIKEMEKEYSLHFFYLEKWIDGRIIPKLGANETIESILEYTLDSYKLAHIDIQQNNVILVPDDYSYFISDQQVSFARMVGNPMEKGKYRKNLVEGHVVNGKTGEPLVGVTVLEKKNNKQTLTGKKGYFSMYLPGGLTQLEFMFIGLETKIIDVDVLSNGSLDVELFETPITLSAVTITSEGSRNVDRTQMGIITLDIRKISKLPSLMGETDVIKSMTLMPGVNSSGEISSGFNVRGGNTDQNLILVNDAPIYSSTHLFGMFSGLISGAISSVNLHKGTQPANFGTRASSVTELKLKDADTSKISGKAGIGILNSSFFLEGPVVKDYCSFFIGARTTYSNWMLKKIPDIDIRRSEASFYDLIGKMDLRLGAKSRINIFGYGSNDYFLYADKIDYAYGTEVGGINYDQLINEAISFHTSFSYSTFHSSVGYFENRAAAYTIKTGIEQLNGRIECKMHVSRHSFIVGMEAIQYDINPGIQERYDENSEASELSLDKEKALEGALFIHDNFKFNDIISLSAGVRYSWYSKMGEAYSNSYLPGLPKNENTLTETRYFEQGEMIKPYQGIEPRTGIKIKVDNASSLKMGYCVTRQYQQLISNTVSTTPTDFWKSADENVVPVINQQYSFGYFRNFMDNIIETSAELYYKTSDNVLEYKNGAELIMNPSIEQDMIACFSKSYGLELMLRKNQGKLTGWFSYTISESLIHTNSIYDEETINNGEFYPTYNDRLHDFSASANYQLTRRWTLGSNFIYSSGRPVTLPEKRYLYHQVELVYYSDRNKYRLPAYHRLDLSITYEGFLKKTSKVHPSFTFSVFNVYGRNNVYSVYYKKANPNYSNHFRQFGLYKLTIIGVPVPSFTINIDF